MHALLGDYFDNNTAVIIPQNSAHLPAIWAFCSSPEFSKAVREIDPQLKVTNASLTKVPLILSVGRPLRGSVGLAFCPNLTQTT